MTERLRAKSYRDRLDKVDLDISQGKYTLANAAKSLVDPDARSSGSREVGQAIGLSAVRDASRGESSGNPSGLTYEYVLTLLPAAVVLPVHPE